MTNEDPKTNKQAFINWLLDNWICNKTGLWHLKTNNTKHAGINLQQLKEIFINSINAKKNKDNTREQ